MADPVQRTKPAPVINALDFNGPAALRRGLKAGAEGQREVARQFESLLVSMLMRSMRTALPGSDMLQSSAAQLATGLLDQQMAGSVAQRGLGLADMLVRQFERSAQSADLQKRLSGTTAGTAAAALPGGASPGGVPGRVSAKPRPAGTGGEGERLVRSDADPLRASGIFRAVALHSPLLQAGEAVRQALRAHAAPVDTAGAASPGNIAAVAPGPVHAALQSRGGAALTSAAPVGIAPAVGAGAANAASAGAGEAIAAGAGRLADSVGDFVARFGAVARKVAGLAGLPAPAMLGQAALETGWGRREMRSADGTNSFNLFGIKAGSEWQGRTVEVLTTEFVSGQPRKQVEKFRAYASYEEGFLDYARLITGNPRYRAAVAQAGDAEAFARAIGKAGYATDPNYGEKLALVVRKVLN